MLAGLFVGVLLCAIFLILAGFSSTGIDDTETRIEGCILLGLAVAAVVALPILGAIYRW